MRLLVIAKKIGLSGGTEQNTRDVLRHLALDGNEIFYIYGYKGRDDVHDMYTFCKKIYFLPDVFSYRGQNGVSELLTEIKSMSPDLIYISDIQNYKFLEALNGMAPVVAYEHYAGLFCPRSSRIYFFSKVNCKYGYGIRCYLHGCFLSKQIKEKGATIWDFLSHCARREAEYRKMRRIIVSSNFMKEQFMKRGFPEKQLCVLPPYVEPPVSKVSDSVNNGTPKVVFVGRVDRYKGVDYLVKAMKHITEDALLVIVGDGDYLSAVSKLVSKLGLQKRVQFLGWKSREDLAKIYGDAAVVVVPSIWNEPFGLVGIEAMANRKPVVAFNVGGISDWLVDGFNGTLAQSKSVKHLGEAINIILLNSDLARQYGDNGFSLYEKKFSKEIYFRRLLEIFNEAGGVFVDEITSS